MDQATPADAVTIEANWPTKFEDWMRQVDAFRPGPGPLFGEQYRKLWFDAFVPEEVVLIEDAWKARRAKDKP
jgi:hypothetical protein